MSEKDSAHAGYHSFRHDDGEEFGTFEVYYASNDVELAGWYWWPCFSGRLPDGEASGPFPTSRDAYEDALTT